MPPKARGRGGARGRGPVRGGSTSVRTAAGTTAAPEDAPPAPDVDVEAAEPSQPPIVPKQEDGGEAPTVATPDVSATLETQLASPIAATTDSSLQTETEQSAPAPAPTRAPRQRLDSLKSADSPSRSTSPGPRRGSSRGAKRGVALPTFTGRRAKSERDARNEEALQREKARNRERDALAERKQRQKENAEKRERDRATRGRGGFGGAVSGPFSLLNKQDKRSVQRSSGGYGAGSGSRGTRVKGEGNDSGPSYRPSGSGTASGSGPAIKREDGGFVSSDDDQDAEFPRKDIDMIEISSDEDQDAPSERRDRMHLPVRIGRKEHQERFVGINTEASAEKSTQRSQQSGASGSTSSGEASGRTAQKGKGKARDVEITGERKPYKGVWSDEPETKVKPEPISDDEETADAEQIGIGATSKQTEGRLGSPNLDRKSNREKAGPRFQTDEDAAEWERYQTNLNHIKAELGPEVVSATDAAGDVDMADAGAAASSKRSVRDDFVYLFQLPPTMPDLLETTVKKEASDPEPGASKSNPGSKEAVGIKKEEEFSSSIAKAPEGPRFASGHAGKLRVHQSGRTTLDWGGTSYELSLGTQASFLQEVVSVQVVPEKARVVEEDAGEAISFGRIKGKFVVTPDFAQMLG